MNWNLKVVLRKERLSKFRKNASMEEAGPDRRLYLSSKVKIIVWSNSEVNRGPCQLLSERTWINMNIGGFTGPKQHDLSLLIVQI